MKPRLALLVDRPGWAYDRAAQALARELADQFTFEILYVVDQPARPDCDLLHVFFWGETWHQRWGFPAAKVVKETSSHRWNQAAYDNLTPPQFVAQHLGDAGTLTATSERLQRIVAPIRPVFLCANGTEVPARVTARTGGVVFGWAGNAQDPCKGVRDVLTPAAGDEFAVLVAGGSVPPAAMAAFYDRIDVLLVASSAEGEPLTLLEAMAHGCYPIATDVGIVRELVQHGDNGMIVARNPAAFRAAMTWATHNPDAVRAAGRRNHERIAAGRRWTDVAPRWAAAWRSALASGAADPGNLAEYNNGRALGQWPERARRAAALVAALALPDGADVLDLGCGQQTVRALLPPRLRYRPYDRLPRTADTTLIDLQNGVMPGDGGDVALLLGVLEYLPDPAPALAWIARHCRHLVFSFADCSNAARRQAQHWHCTLSGAQMEQLVARLGGVVRRSEPHGEGQRLHHVEFAAAPAGSRRTGGRKPIALFTSAFVGSNSGDALIEHAVRALLPDREFVRVPMLQKPGPEHLERANACEIGILCGTNLYQRTFASGIDLDTLAALRIPLLPLGIGGSTAVGETIAMEPAGTAVVRELHARCQVGSVRDPQALAFVRGLGIANVELTGCPVLFSGITAPDFTPRTGCTTLSIRARLLHVDAALGAAADALNEAICATERPVLVLQSAHDEAPARTLAGRHGLQVVADPAWQAALVDLLPQVARTVGLRLHWNMLCLSRGIPAVLLGTDTRTSSFCAMMGLPFHAVHAATPQTLLAELRAPRDWSRFVHRWHVLQRSMRSVLERNGLQTAWQSAVPELVGR